MSCCGQGRAALRSAAPDASQAVPRNEPRVLVQYQAAAPIAVRGVDTGRLYRFDANQPRQHVAQADAAALLRSRFFLRVD
jgi:hypothetical protein